MTAPHRELFDRARRLRGPLVIAGRPHSGTRVLARVLSDCGVLTGDVTPDFLDSMPWCTRFVVPLVTSRFFPRWPDLDGDPAFARFVAERLDDTLARVFGGDLPGPGAVWGWKFPETLFVMPLIKRLFPGARFVHVLRDGRDVCLSDGGYFQLTGHHGDPPGWDLPPLGDAARADAGREARATFRDFCFALTFGDAACRRFRDIDTGDRAQLSDHRFLLQMQSWVHCVSVARDHGRALGDDYLEIRYEDLCHRPIEITSALLARLGLQRPPGLDASLLRTVTPSRIGKWRSQRLSASERRDFESAVELGAPLLRECGYDV